MRLLLSFKENLLNFLFPKNPRVLELENLPAWKLLDILPACEGASDEGVSALFDYSHWMVKEIIWEIKYNGNRILAEKMGSILYDAICAELEEKNIFNRTHSVLLLPMPISDRRRFERGWNQCELIAGAIKIQDASRRFKYLPRQLAKIIHTESQTRTANKKQRQENLDKSMLVQNPLSVKDRFVVLIDDVTTTGSTFKEARRALKAAGAKKIFCFAVAH